MAVDTDKNTYTVIFAGLMVVVVGSVLAFLASGLGPTIKQNERYATQQDILYAMGVNENGDDAGSVSKIPTDKVEAEFTNFIKEQFVIEDGKTTPNDEAFLIDLKKQLASKNKGNSYKLPLFVGEKDNKNYYIIPMYGKGLWDAIWGYIALDDTMTVQGVYFDHKAETAGLGANIKMRYFLDDFTGESILDGTKYAGIAVAKGNNDPLNNRKDDNAVDAIAGATITGNGVAAMISESVNLYKDYLETIRVK
jgi:Na+-transporting NADH:ubiquinone oxidoreductase subunit C